MNGIVLVPLSFSCDLAHKISEYSSSGSGPVSSFGLQLPNNRSGWLIRASIYIILNTDNKLQDVENWTLHRGWPLNRWPLNRGSSVIPLFVLYQPAQCNPVLSTCAT